jgi:hypothetical protein
MMLNGRIGLSAVMLVIFGGMVALGATYPAHARFLPLVIGIPGAALCAAQLVIEVLEAFKSVPPKDRDAAAREFRRGLKMFGWLFAFLVAILLAGFLVATPVLLFAFLRVAQRESYWVAAGGAAVGIAIIYGVFVELLGLTVFNGFLLEAVFR